MSLDAIGGDVDSELIPAELRLLPSVRYYRGQITNIREFSRHCSHVGVVKQGNVMRFSVGVILRKATYVYVTAVYQGAILDGCWGEMGRGEKRNNIFLSSSPSPSSLPLLTHQRVVVIYSSPQSSSDLEIQGGA